MSGLLLRTVRLALLAGVVSTMSFAHAGAAEPAADTDTTATDAMLASAEVTDADLDASRGAYVPVEFGFNSVEQSAESSHNVVIGGNTGMNVIGNGSISNTQGLVNVIQNSGNNVIIQSSTVVNMTFNNK